MPTLPRIALPAALAVMVVMMSGCGATPPPDPSPSPTPTPVFKSEEEALAAATEAYAAYLKMSDLITSEGGRAPERIEPFVTDDYGQAERDSFTELQANGNTTQGQSTFDSVRVQRFDPENSSGEAVTTYLCFDVSEVRLIGKDGVDVTPADRPLRVPLEVGFYLNNSSPTGLTIGRNEVWAGESFC